jgi:uncharacterized membrane protein
LAGNPIVIVGWIALLGGLLTLLARAIFGSAVPVGWAQIGLVVFVAGAALLISRLPRRRQLDDYLDDDPNDAPNDGPDGP